ncbi:MAG: T9SS type A sorting domain-containing protein [Candidatus Delongbacteria bacterium]|nr:T9SS type A sorting domain-containing protein [Candidatus Cloacimonadota bacterium]MCA9787850.1 T9SS type A sorting domain-containing protein [Candidatus Cloacimonadota bacterium]MCB9473620.1 T9SS type A sorting domain-containing protein [Candidatus Delongbacteria bacterium]
MNKWIGVSLLACAASAWATQTITFQVNMSVQEALGNFVPGSDNVVVRGSFNGWGGTDPTLSPIGDGVYSGTYDLDDALIGETVTYKFVNAATSGDVWESIEDRSFVVGDTGAQTVDGGYFDNLDTVPALLDAEITFLVNMEIMIDNGSFVPASDLIVIRGNNDGIGNWGGAVALNEVGGNPGHYFLQVQFDQVSAETPVEYKFVILTDGDENLARWESVANRTAQPTEAWPDEDQNGYHEYVTEEAFFDNVTWDDILSQNVDVTFNVDLNMVDTWFTEHPGETNQGITGWDAINYVAICGPWNNWPWDLVPPQYQFANAGGTLFSGTVTFTSGSARSITYKYGINGSDNESGFQADWVTVIDDTNPTFTINNEFGSLGDLWGTTAVNPASQPRTFELGEAYPNPFNPSTVIEFSLVRPAVVELTVFNMMGQAVATLASGMHQAGNHTTSFDAAGLSSGVYFYTLKANGMSETRKVLLVK